MPEPKQKKLTIKQKKFVKEYVSNDGNGTKAALEVYDTEDYKTATAIAVENLAKPSIRDAIETSLEKHEITIDDAVAPIAKALKAKKVFYIEGQRIESDYDDLDMQLKGSDRYMKLVGADKTDTPANTINNFGNMLLQQKGKYDE